jgi:hypothetical protein
MVVTNSYWWSREFRYNPVVDCPTVRNNKINQSKHGDFFKLDQIRQTRAWILVIFK